jgi:hypothetical protein
MNEAPQRESAKIYQFPAGGRGSKSTGRVPQGKIKELSAQYAVTDYGSGWYHDAAVREAELASKR